MKLDRPRIVVVGSANMDLVVRSDRIPAPGETVLGGQFYQIPGGKGANQAVAAARLGADVYFIAAVGTDAFGDRLLSELQASGVNTLFVHRCESAPTGVALISVDSDGSNSIVVAPGANSQVNSTQIDSADELIRGAHALVVQLEVPLAVVEYVLKLANEYSVRTVLNPAPCIEPDYLRGNILPYVDLLIPNEHEALSLTGLEDKSDEASQASALLALGPKCVALTLGEMGCFVAGEDGQAYIPSDPVQAVDTTAAGDCFVGAITVALAEGRSLTDAARFANIAAGISVTRLGALPSLPNRAEIRAE